MLNGSKGCAYLSFLIWSIIGSNAAKRYHCDCSDAIVQVEQCQPITHIKLLVQVQVVGRVRILEMSYFNGVTERWVVH
jgi:hypothetical protein